MIPVGLRLNRWASLLSITGTDGLPAQQDLLDPLDPVENPNRSEYGHVLQDPGLIVVVFSVENPHRIIKMVSRLARYLAGARPFEMGHCCPGVVVDSPSVLCRTVAEIQILSIQEEILIQP